MNARFDRLKTLTLTTVEKKHKNSAQVGWVEGRNPTHIDDYWLAPNFTTELA